MMQSVLTKTKPLTAPVSRLSNYSHEEDRTATPDEVLDVSGRLIARHRKAYLKLAK